MVGFNRRFAPLVQQAKAFLRPSSGPVGITYRVNAGPIPSDHWVQDPQEGGGRIIGEVCHFADLIHFLADATPQRVFAQAMPQTHPRQAIPDNVMVTIVLSDGSLGTIQYLSIGDPSFPKERIEIFGQNSVVVIDDFKTLTMTRGGKRRHVRQRGQDKGHRNELEAFVTALKKNSQLPVSFEDALWATLVTFQIMEALKVGGPVKVDLSQVMDQ
jgi:predicted dehydrogenase